ncbi:MAG: hypothetical protein WKF83_04065 [Nocardioidaceae bacterium]
MTRGRAARGQPTTPASCCSQRPALLARTGDDSAVGVAWLPGQARRGGQRRAGDGPRAGGCGDQRSGGCTRLDVLDLPALPGTASAPHLQGGVPVPRGAVPRPPASGCIALTDVEGDGPGLALGTRAGVVKRVRPGLPRQQGLLGGHLP